MHGKVGTCFTNPANYFLVKEYTHHERVWLVASTFLHGKIFWAFEGLRKQHKLIHAFKAEIAYVLAHMTIGDKVPGVKHMDQAIGISSAGILLTLPFSRMAGMITKAHSSSVHYVAPQLTEHVCLTCVLTSGVRDCSNTALQ